MLTPKHLTTLTLALAATLAHADVVVIVHPKNAATLTAADVAAIYTGKTTAFPGGATAVPVSLPEGAPGREEFMSRFVGKTDAQYKAIWTRITFSGKGVNPRELGSEAEVKKFVAGNPDAIGFIDKGSVDASVKAAVKAP